MEIYISKKDINKKVLMECLEHKEILCNVTPYTSIVFNKEAKKYIQEQGFKIEALNIGNKQLISLWDTLRNNLKIHCMYIKDIDILEDYNSEGYRQGFYVNINYEGCITELPDYLNYCKKNNIKPLKCSEY